MDNDFNNLMPDTKVLLYYTINVEGSPEGQIKHDNVDAALDEAKRLQKQEKRNVTIITNHTKQVTLRYVDKTREELIDRINGCPNGIICWVGNQAEKKIEIIGWYNASDETFETLTGHRRYKKVKPLTKKERQQYS